MSWPRYPSSTSSTAVPAGRVPMSAATCPAGILAPVVLVTTGAESLSVSAATSIPVVVVFPLVPETSAMLRSLARMASSRESMASPARPPMTVPLPRPSRRDIELMVDATFTATDGRSERREVGGEREAVTPEV
jgi:hypothetical protein